MRVVSFLVTLISLVHSSQLFSKSLSAKKVSNCTNFSGAWKGNCLRDGILEFNILRIEPLNCLYFSINSIIYKIGVPVESTTQDDSTLTTNSDLLAWQDQSLSTITMDSSANSKVVLPNFVLDYRVKGRQTLFLKGGDLVSESTYLETAIKNGEIKEFTRSTSCEYKNS